MMLLSHARFNASSVASMRDVAMHIRVVRSIASTTLNRVSRSTPAASDDVALTECVAAALDNTSAAATATAAVRTLAARAPTRVPFKDMVRLGLAAQRTVLLQASLWVADELSVRVARRVAEIARLPPPARPHPDVADIVRRYVASVIALRVFVDDTSHTLHRAATADPSLAERAAAAAAPLLPTSLARRIASRYIAFRGPRDNRDVVVVDVAACRGRPLSPAGTSPLYTGAALGFPNTVWDRYLNARFAAELAALIARHSDVVVLVARVFRDAANVLPVPPDVHPGVQAFLDRLHHSRVGVRLLVAHHIQLLRQFNTTRGNTAPFAAAPVSTNNTDTVSNTTQAIEPTSNHSIDVLDTDSQSQQDNVTSIQNNNDRDSGIDSSTGWHLTGPAELPAAELGDHTSSHLRSVKPFGVGSRTNNDDGFFVDSLRHASDHIDGTQQNNINQLNASSTEIHAEGHVVNSKMQHQNQQTNGLYNDVGSNTERKLSSSPTEVGITATTTTTKDRDTAQDGSQSTTSDAVYNTKQESSPRIMFARELPKYVGIICTQTDIVETISEAAEDATFICERTHGRVPGVKIYQYADDDPSKVRAIDLMDVTPDDTIAHATSSSPTSNVVNGKTGTSSSSTSMSSGTHFSGLEKNVVASLPPKQQQTLQQLQKLLQPPPTTAESNNNSTQTGVGPQQQNDGPRERQVVSSQLTYIPVHARHILFELIKNAFTASLMTAAKRAQTHPNQDVEPSEVSIEVVVHEDRNKRDIQQQQLSAAAAALDKDSDMVDFTDDTTVSSLDPMLANEWYPTEMQHFVDSNLFYILALGGDSSGDAADTQRRSEDLKRFGGDFPLPPRRPSGVSVFVIDRGGGIPHNAVDKIFNYAYTTSALSKRDETFILGGSDPTSTETFVQNFQHRKPGSGSGTHGNGSGSGSNTSGHNNGNESLGERVVSSLQERVVSSLGAIGVIENAGKKGKEKPLPPMSGLGYGLPLSRLYARFLGGEVAIYTKENCGTIAEFWIPAEGCMSSKV